MAPPFVDSCGSAQRMNDILKPICPHRDPKIALRQQHIPTAVGDHFKRLIQRPEDLGQRIAAWPPAQTTPQGRSGFELITLTLKSMGSATGLIVGLKHQHIAAGPGTQGTATEPTDATADDHHIDPVLHPAKPAGVIIVIAASCGWVAVG